MVLWIEIREEKFLPEKRNFSKGRRQINTATWRDPADPKKTSCSTIGAGVLLIGVFGHAGVYMVATSGVYVSPLNGVLDFLCKLSLP